VIATSSPDGGSSGGPGSDGSGSATNSHDGSAGSNGPGPDVGSNHAGSDQGSAHSGSNVGSADGSDAGSNTPPPVEVVSVLLIARNGAVFDVYEDGKMLFEGPDNLEVPKGEKRKVVIKARGFKDKTIVVDGKKKRVMFSLDRVATPGPGPGPVPPPPGPDCSNRIVDGSKACVAQYCAKHPDDQAKCGLE
jgi:hypothetical protein